ncbi:MAG: transglycosylase SLT domain-containing protein [Gemmatimonadota bacterium]|nr:transglycosylase SLT domain-containing protein [Gemmatimonadota bacterium]
MTPLARPLRVVVLAVFALALLRAPATGMPVVPPGLPGWEDPAASSSAACPLHWRPGEPAAAFPHPPAGVDDRGARLRETSGWAAARIARGWVEVGRPAEALRALEGAPATPRTRLYRLAALAAAERWEELAEALDDASGPALPAGCGPLRDRWTAPALAATGSLERADRAWERLRDALPELGSWIALWRLEDAARRGDLARGAAAWGEVVASGLPAEAKREARILRARLYASAGRPERAHAAFLEAAAAAGEPRRGELWLAGAEQAERAGDRAAADRLRARVIARAPASAARLVLDPPLRRRIGVSLLDAARVLRAAGRLAPAESLATAVIETEGGDPEARLLRAAVRAARGDRAGAEADYAAFLGARPNDRRVPEVLYDRARLALRGDDGEIARRRFANLVARFPDHARADDAMYLRADSWQDDREKDSEFADLAIEGFDRLVATRPGSYFADRAAMRAAHLAYAVGRVREAERRYADYRGGQSAREARYWRARALERLGEGRRARAILRSLAATGGGDYYALLSRRRLGIGGEEVVFRHRGTRRGPEASYRPLGRALLEDPAGRTAAALLAMGERRWARAELERAVARLDGEGLAAWAPALAAWGFPGLTLRIGVRLGGENHPWAWPAGFAVSLDREARVHRLDAWYLLAIVRQESLFRAHAVSPADARGLMQILPETGREIAASSGWNEFDESLLFDPAVNLHFGASYVADQIERFDGFWPAVLSAYNGGPHNVAVWWDFPERTLDAELWVERIPFRETRDYVKRIVAQRVRYRHLLGGEGPAAGAR